MLRPAALLTSPSRRSKAPSVAATAASIDAGSVTSTFALSTRPPASLAESTAGSALGRPAPRGKYKWSYYCFLIITGGFDIKAPPLWGGSLRFKSLQGKHA
jgi:hypothetical protein